MSSYTDSSVTVIKPKGFMYRNVVIVLKTER